MPTTLPNGIEIFNGTQHTLYFYHDTWDEPAEVPSDGVIDLVIETDKVSRHQNYELVAVKYIATKKGEEQIAEIKRDYPHALIVSSNVAAQAYRGELVCPIPHHTGEKWTTKKLNRANRFNIYKKGEPNHGSF